MVNLLKVFGVTVKSIQGRALYFETYLPEYGALYDKLPISQHLYGKKILQAGCTFN